MAESEINIAAYVARTGYAGPLAPTRETLVGLHRAQAYSIPFENLDIHLGRPIGLDAASLSRKLLAERRGGYCYELNGLFGRVLRQLGFAVTNLVGRNLIAGAPLRPRAHQLLLVEAEGRAWVADLGFGGNTLLEPIPLETGPAHRMGFDTYRLQAAPQHNYHLQLLLDGQWQSLGRGPAQRLPDDELLLLELARFAVSAAAHLCPRHARVPRHAGRPRAENPAARRPSHRYYTGR